MKCIGDVDFLWMFLRSRVLWLLAAWHACSVPGGYKITCIPSPHPPTPLIILGQSFHLSSNLVDLTPSFFSLRYEPCFAWPHARHLKYMLQAMP